MPKHYILVANWKMNGTCRDLSFFASSLSQHLVKLGPSINFVLCCPHILMHTAMTCLSSNDRVFLGGQDCAIAMKGSFTGDTSPSMLAEKGCKYTIVGHSERRKLYHESNFLVLSKAKAAISAGLIPIICISGGGSSINEIDQLSLSRECTECFPDLSHKFIVAYEPLAAIGTGDTPSMSALRRAHEVIRKYTDTQILYGGSVTDDNVQDILNADLGFAGVLVGKKSLSFSDFSSIADTVARL